MSSMVKLPSSSDNNNSYDDGHEQLDFQHPTNLTTVAAANLCLSPDMFLGAAAALKELVVETTWTEACAGGDEIMDPTVYTGLLGTALTCLRYYEATGSREDLQLSANIVRACAAAVANTSTSRYTTFLCGRGGIYALGAVIANHCGDLHNRNFYLAEFLELAQEKALPVGPKEGGFGMSYDLLHGRAGFLYAALFINKHIGQDTVPSDLLTPIIEAVIDGGRAGASDHPLCPLMYRWHGTRYLGAAHGLAGILHVLLHFPLSEQDTDDVKKTLRYMMSKRFPQGNYPSSEGNPRDNLVQWSHGAGGMAITLCKAAQVFPQDREFRDAAIEAGEVVWKSGLLEKAGLADGASGNAYVFLALFRLTGDVIYEERAKAFGGFLYGNIGKLKSSANGCGIYTCNECGTNLNLHTANLFPPDFYFEAGNKGTLSFAAIDSSKFRFVKEDKIRPFFETINYWGIQRKRTKLICNSCGRLVGHVYDDGPPMMTGTGQFGFGPSQAIPRAPRYRFKTKTLRITSET